MKRPILVGAVFVFTGAVCAVCLNIYIASVIGALELAVCACSFKRKNLSRANYIYLLICLVTMLIVFINTSHKLSLSFYEKQLEQSKGEGCVILGNVADVSEKNGYVQLKLVNCNITLDKSGRVIEGAAVILYAKTFNGFTGDKVRALGKLKAFERPRNDGEFDIRTYYHSVGVDYCCDSYAVELIELNNNEIQKVVKGFSSKVSHVFNRITDEEDAGILSSVVLGDKSNLDSQVKLLYQTSGIAHLLAISGLHVSIIGMGLYRLLRRFLTFFPAAAFGGVIMILYLFMAGSGISVLRAVIMFLISLCGEVIGRTYDFLTSIAVAAIFLIVNDGRVIMNSGFWLSFTALAGICLVFPVLSGMFNHHKAKTMKAKLVDAVLVSIGVQISTLPVVLWCYYQFPVFGFVLNLIVIPLMSLLMISGIVAGIIGLFSLQAASFMIGSAYYILRFYKLLCQWYEKIPKGICVTGKPSVSAIVVYVCVVILIMAYFSAKCGEKAGIIKLAAVILFAASLLFLKRQPEQGLLVNMIDVGQGDSIFVRTHKGITFLFDGGSTDIKNVGTKRILPYLKSQGVGHLDYVIISHADSDHISGILELIEMQNRGFSIGKIVLPDIINWEEDDNYVNVVNSAQNAGINLVYGSEGDSIEYGNELLLTCVHPKEGYQYESANDYSAVYLLKYKNFKMLFTGDAQLKAEKAILEGESEKMLGHINILKVGHHGSKGSSGEDFLRILRPETALISCGVDNGYGHPHNETLERLLSNNCKAYVTSSLGAIKVVTDGNTYTIQTFLKTNY